ncbi:MAG: hypothetical protein V3U76_02465 [Granulosicoccus sp.]
MLRQSLVVLLAVSVLSGGVIFWKYWNLAETPYEALSKGQYARAVELLDEPALKGSVKAQVMLGNLHYTGLGVEQSYAEAAHWYEQAGMQGNAGAQYNRALIYNQSGEDEKDLIAATAWFLLADAGGNPHAEIFLRSLSGSLNPNMIQQAHRLQEKLSRQIGGADS